MVVLLLAEVNNGELSLDATAKAVNAAKVLGDVTVLAAGGAVAAAGEAAAKIDGVSKVLVAEDASLGHRLAESTAALIVGLADGYEHIVAPATTDAKNVMPRVAALLDVMVISDASGIVDGSTFERPIYAGNAIQTVKSNDTTKCRRLSKKTRLSAKIPRFLITDDNPPSPAFRKLPGSQGIHSVKNVRVHFVFVCMGN